MHVVGVDARNLFQAVADATRIRILRVLVDHKEEACLCELTDSLLEPQYNLSRHLKVLRQAGLLTASKEGRWVYHGLVMGSKHISKLYSLIASLPDIDNVFRDDSKRFGKRKPLRNAGRCRTERPATRGRPDHRSLRQ